MTTLKEQRTESAVKKGYDYFEKTFNCNQSTLGALLREFLPDNPGIEELIKAGSAMPGIGVRNETCGAVSGGVLFLGVLYGGDGTQKPMMGYAETKKFTEKMSVATEYCYKFIEKMGSTMCKDVHTKIMGKQYEFTEFEPLMKFYNDGASTKCQAVVEAGIRIVCDLILDENGKIINRD